MSVIQKIQDKYAKLMAIIIAVALMIFVVMLAFENGGSLFRGGNTSTVGKVNGKTIEYTDFMRKVDQQEKNMEARGYGSGSQLQQQAVDAVWNDEINQILQDDELNKLGITVGKREMGDVLYGPNAPEDLKRLFTDTSTGQYNGQLAKQQIDATLRLKKGTAEQLQQRDQIIAFINFQETTRLKDKYTSLFSNSVNYAKWFVEKQIADNSQMAKISLVRNNYSSNTDSTIKVSDKEIQDYLDKHKKDFKQQMQESRSISYVAFSTLPSGADSAAAKDKVISLKTEFDTTKNVASFLSANGSGSPVNTVYAGKSQMQMQNKDTLQKLPIGVVYGPYLDGTNFALAKMLDVKELPDSVKCRHILLGTVDRSGQPLLDDSTAHKRADSIALAIKNGAKFDSLEAKFSSDQAAHKDKGVMTFSSTDIQGEGFAKEFGDFILFDGKPGDKKVVHTQFGWHYIEILNFIKPEPHYKIAYFSRPIEASNETESNASNLAAQFASESHDQKSFDANAAKYINQKGFVKSMAADIQPSAYQIPGLGSSRSLVKKIYKADLGDILEPEKAGENYVVALVTEINEEGTLPLAKARMQIEPTLRNKKVAASMIKKLGSVTTLEAAATAFGNKPIESIDSLRMLGAQSSMAARAISSEPRVIGASFNPSNRGKVVPQAIEGVNAIYVVRVDNVVATAVAEANVADQRKTRYQQGKQMAAYRSPIQVLRDAATVKDRRINFF